MTRIFSVLALCCVGLLIANITVGLWGGDYNECSQKVRASHQRLRELRSEVTPDEAAIEETEKQIALLVDQLRPLQRHATVHVLLGVLAALSTVLVNSISVTYFIGTSRWCKEVTEAYHLAPELAQRSARLKRRSFVWALLGMLAAVCFAALGAAADPGTLRPDTARWVLPHATAAIVGTTLIGYSLYVQHSRIADNYEVINTILTQVHRIRRERGLDVESS